MKAIIKRNLSLETSYSLVDKNYIPIIDGYGACCADCGRLISHIATVKDDNGKHWDVGFDCLEKLLMNSAIICNFNAEQLKDYKRQLNAIVRFAKELSKTIKENPTITGILFEAQAYESDWYTFYYLQNNETKSRNNDSKKIKGITYKLLHTVMNNILGNTVEIYYQNEKIK